MATTENGHLAASPINVEPTELQRAAHSIAEALNSQNGIDWAAVEENFNTLTGGAGYELPLLSKAEARLPESTKRCCLDGCPWLLTLMPSGMRLSKQRAVGSYLLPTAYRSDTGSLGSSKIGYHGVASRC